MGWHDWRTHLFVLLICVSMIVSYVTFYLLVRILLCDYLGTWCR